MAGLVRLPTVAVATLGIGVIALHNIADAFLPQLTRAASSSSVGWLWQLLYFGGSISLGGGEDAPRLAVLYSIIPWIGVMAAGFAFGRIMTLDIARRRRWCYALGSGAIAVFLILRGFNLYGDPRPWGDAARRAQAQRQAAQRQAAQRQAAQRQAAQRETPPQAPPATGTPPSTAGGQAQPTVTAPRRQAPPPTPAVFQFLGTNKYPASLLFLLMTLGPTILVLPLLERARGPVARVLTVFGRVPFFYYVLHIPLIHLIFVALSLVRFGSVIPWLTANHPMFAPPAPPGYTYSLLALYAITVLVVGLLYFPCRWFADLKSRRSDRWLSYL
jgi:uncharacterized membrane protein